MAGTIVTKGELIAFTSGEYSDYCFNGVWRALRDCDLADLGRQYLTAHPDQAKKYRFDDSAFAAWLVSIDAFEEVPVREFHSGANSCWNPSIGTVGV